MTDNTFLIKKATVQWLFFVEVTGLEPATFRLRT